MGAWGPLAFDNDTANDWAYGLYDCDDLSLVEEAFEELEGLGDEYVDQDVACVALAACEVLARCQGNTGYTNAYTKKVDGWVAARAIKAPLTLLKRGAVVIERVLGERSELRSLWEAGGDGDEWRAGVEELRRRLVWRSS